MVQKTGRFGRTMNERKSHELYSKVERIENVSGQIVVLGLFVCFCFFSTNIQRAIKYTRIYAEKFSIKTFWPQFLVSNTGDGDKP